MSDALEAAAKTLLDSVVTKGLDQVRDAKVKGYLTEVWGGLKNEMPALFDALVGDGEVVLSGKYLEESKKVLAKMGADVLAFKDKKIDEIDYKDLIERRKAALFALYRAQTIHDGPPSTQRVLMAMARIAEVFVLKGLPYILALI